MRRKLSSTRSVEIEGFTLIELMIVVAIISVLGTIAFYHYSAVIEKAKVTKAIADIKEIAREIDQFNQEYGVYPASLEEIERGRIKDPWGYPYQYVCIAEDEKTDKAHQKARQDRNQRPINTYYDLWSNGADGDYQKQVNGAKSRDDVIRAWDGGFVGLGKDLDDLYGMPSK